MDSLNEGRAENATAHAEQLAAWLPSDSRQEKPLERLMFKAEDFPAAQLVFIQLHVALRNFPAEKT